MCSGSDRASLISSRGIEANPNKIRDIVDMKPLRNIKEVQRLIGCIATLGRFMSRSANKCQPFFRILRRRANLLWDQEADEAFQALKTYLAHLPKIASPLPRETLLPYLDISKQAISMVLLVQRAKE